MKSILSTCVLFLVLPWKLTGEVTFMSNYTRQQEDASNYHETTIRGDELATSSPKNSENTLKTNGGTTQSPSNTTLHEESSKHETTMWNNEPTSFTLKNQDEYITEKSKTTLSLKSPPQTSEHYVTSMSHGAYLTHAMTISTEESRSLPLRTELMQKKTDRITTPPPVLDISKGVTTNRDDHQTVHNFNSTNKDLDRYTQADKTNKSAEKYSTPQIFTDNSTQFQSSPRDITNQSGVEVETTGTLTTKWSSLPQEKEITHTPTLIITNGTLNISNEERNDTATYPYNISTTTGLSTGLSSAVDPKVGTTGITDTTNTTAIYETTKDHISERNRPNPNSESTSTTQKINTESPIPKPSNNKKIHPGPIVGSLIGTILILMLVAFVMIWVKNRKTKKYTDNPDWAGPSPFIEADMHPNLPTINDGGSFHRQEPKRISLHSFLPQRFSKRLSLLNSMDEGVPLEDTQAGSTFGQCNTQPLNGNATADQIQKNETNSPPAEVSSDSNAEETISNLPALENNEDTQKTPKLDEIIPSPHAEKNNTNPTPFEDVDLNPSLDKDIESTSSDAINNPPPPPPAQS